MIGKLTKALSKTFGSVMKTKGGPASGLIPTEKAAGKITNPAKIATNVSIIDTWMAVFVKFVSLLKYEA